MVASSSTKMRFDMCVCDEMHKIIETGVACRSSARISTIIYVHTVLSGFSRQSLANGHTFWREITKDTCATVCATVGTYVV
jgi:hypothetical protein